jgi:hypothetical protein
MQGKENVPVGKVTNTKMCKKAIKKYMKIIQDIKKDFHAENKHILFLNKFITLHTSYYYYVTFKIVVHQNRFCLATYILLKIIQSFESLQYS